MKISALRGKARRNTLEVEHILGAAKARLPGLNDELQRLSQELEWPNSMYLPDGTHVVPLAKWAEIAGAYADGGIDALSHLAAEPENANYIIGLLEELRSREAIDALIVFFHSAMHAPTTAPETAWRLVKAFNMLLSIKGAVVPTDAQASAVRAFLMSLFAIATSETQKAWLAYALRGVGDQSSIDMLATLADFPPPYSAAKTSAIRAIRQRLRA